MFSEIGGNTGLFPLDLMTHILIQRKETGLIPGEKPA
jgi:hypothetical protein